MQLPFDPFYFLSKYVPYVDWDDFKLESQKYAMEKKTSDDMITAATMSGMQSGQMGM